MYFNFNKATFYIYVAAMLLYAGMMTACNSMAEALVKSWAVNCTPWSVLKISGWLCRNAWRKVVRQKAAGVS